jgi:hypothetical protein
LAREEESNQPKNIQVDAKRCFGYLKDINDIVGSCYDDLKHAEKMEAILNNRLINELSEYQKEITGYELLKIECKDLRQQIADSGSRYRDALITISVRDGIIEGLQRDHV